MFVQRFYEDVWTFWWRIVYVPIPGCERKNGVDLELILS